MKRRSKAGGKPVKTRHRKAVTLKRNDAPKFTRHRGSSAAGLSKKVALFKRERDEALERQTATSEVLRVISSSPGDLKPIFAVILANATRLCQANFGVLFLCEGDAYHAVAMHNAPSAYVEARQREPLVSMTGTTILAQVARTKRTIQTADITKDPAYHKNPRSTQFFVRLTGARSFVAVPMLKDDELVGAIAIYRQEVRSFTDKQIELVQNFAAQAVIAIENTRLLNELRESLEQQTATAGVLGVISSSPGALEPVFNAMLENATRICGAQFGALFLSEADAFRTVALHGGSPEFIEARWREPVIRPNPSIAVGRVAATKKPVQIADIRTEPSYTSDPKWFAVLELAGARTMLNVPMLKDNEVVGQFAIYRQEVQPFTDKQIELVETFAAQAVIAIENTRLLSELRESLQQQTATADVLKVISSSPGELEPVFNAMLENATRICEAKSGFLFRADNDGFRIVASLHGQADFVEQMKHQAFKFGPLTPNGRAALTRQIVHVPDLSEDQAYLEREPLAVWAVEQANVRTVLVVPMIKEEELIGVFGIEREEVRPFTDKQIALVTSFAAQAVIAIENTRLLKELRRRTDDLTESLEQQTATSEVLSVISSSPGELEPVFQAMLENARRICDARFGNIYRWDGNSLHLIAAHNVPSAYAEFRKHAPFRPSPNIPTGRMVATKMVTHVADLAGEPAYAERDPDIVAGVELGGIRTLLSVPMLKEHELVGAFTIYRDEVRPFTDKQIELVKNFAAQAVIAIENTRLLSELRESLQQQTAAADVLKVISSSPGELEPVFNAMLENATRICEAKFGNLLLYEGDIFRRVALHNAPQEWVADWQRDPYRRRSDAPILYRVADTKEPVHVVDMALEAPDDSFSDLASARTVLIVPMLKEGELIGAIGIYRQESRLFSEKQIALLKSFAAQAVIAIENTRLLNELRQSLQQQTATADVLEVISRSAFDLNAVFETVAESSVRLCGADRALIFRFDGELLRLAVAYNAPQELKEFVERNPIRPGRHSASARAALERRTIHIPDCLADPEYTYGSKDVAPIRTNLGVPILKGDELLGVLLIYHLEVRPFTDKQIALVETFADQAAIAIENVRLFEAEQQRTRELAKSLENLRTAQDRLVQTEKLASLGQLTAGIAHEIKNPLNFVNNFSSVSVELIDELREALAGAQLDGKRSAEIGEIADMLQGNLDKVVQHGKRADAIVKNMLLHSRQGSGEHRPVDVNALVEESLNLAYHGARAEKQGFNITLERSLDPAAGEVDLFPQEITRVLLNLISNGFYAATKRKAEANGGNYEPTLIAATKNLGNSVEIRIRDNGTGIPPEVKEQMFNPFFTTKPAGEGTGLGLSISHDIIVKQHGGSIDVVTQPGAFTEFRIVLPRAVMALNKSGERA
jgi:GAF domain-containing protein